VTQKLSERPTEVDPKPSRPLLRRWWPVLALASVLAVAIVALTLAQRDGSDPGSPPASVARVGPEQGQPVDEYLSQAATRLDGLAGTEPTYALVQLRAYTAPDGLPPLLPAEGVTVVRAMMRAPIPQVQTEIITAPLRGDVRSVPADVTRAMDQQVAGKRADADDAKRSARGLTGSSRSESRLRDFYQDSADISRAEADAFAAHCACVYALVVRAVPEVLRQLATVGGVRATDPAAGVDELNQAAFVPLLPEQVHSVEPLPDLSLDG
jgi:hypothetical protein